MFFALLGFVGSAIIVFSKLGGLLPGMTEGPTIRNLKAELRLRAEKLSQLEDKQEKITGDREKNRQDFQNGKISKEAFEVIGEDLNKHDDDIRDLRNAVASEKKDLTGALHSEMGKVFAMAALLYVAIGTVLAGLFASDALNAIVIGASWTSIISLIEQKSTELKWDKILVPALEKAEHATELVSELKTRLEQVSDERDKLQTLFSEYIKSKGGKI